MKKAQWETMAERRVTNSFIDWFESLTPEDREIWMRVMGRVIKGVMMDE